MNYFAHGIRFIHQPYVLAGTAVPDWLNVVDRKVRARAKGARPLVDDPDPRVAGVARGIVQHHDDDDWFHRTRAFTELSWQFTVAIRDVLEADEQSPDDGFRPSFLGHILVELLLDAVLIEQSPGELERYYSALEDVDAALVQDTVNRIATRPADRLAEFIELFRQHRFLFDYADDERLMFRLNQVMRRVRLPALPDSLVVTFPEMRQQVGLRKEELLPFLPLSPE